MSLLRSVIVIGVAMIAGFQVATATELGPPQSFEECYSGGQCPLVLERLSGQAPDQGNPFVFSPSALRIIYGYGFDTARILHETTGRSHSVDGFLAMYCQDNPALLEMQVRVKALLFDTDNRGYSAWTSGYIDCNARYTPPPIAPQPEIPHAGNPQGTNHSSKFKKIIKTAFNVGVLLGITYVYYPEYFKRLPFYLD
jgi:hypothetical protein